MVTKATRDVIDLSIRDVQDIVVNPTGTGSSIDNVPIGATTPSTGAFTTLTGTNVSIPAGGTLTLGSGVTVSGLNVSIPTAATGNTVAVSDLVISTDGRVFINATASTITLSGTTAASLVADGLTEVVITSSPKFGGIAAANVGSSVDPYVLVASSDGVIMANLTAAAITPTGTTETALQGNGFTSVGPTASASVVPPSASTSTAVAANGMTVSSDGYLMANLTGAAITPTGTTKATMVSDGFTVVAPDDTSSLPAAATGSSVANGDMILSSDNVIFANLSGAPITPTGTTASTLLSDGFTRVAPDLATLNTPAAVTGTAVAAGDLILSSDNVIFANLSGGSITPTGTTATTLLSDGFTRVAPDLATLNTPAAVTGTAVAAGDLILSSDNVIFANLSGGSITPTGTTATTLLSDGFTRVAPDLGGSSGVIPSIAAIGTSIGDKELVWSTDTPASLMANLSGAAIVPSTGTATEADLITDGLTVIKSGSGGNTSASYVISSTRYTSSTTVTAPANASWVLVTVSANEFASLSSAQRGPVIYAISGGQSVGITATTSGTTGEVIVTVNGTQKIHIKNQSGSAVISPDIVVGGDAAGTVNLGAAPSVGGETTLGQAGVLPAPTPSNVALTFYA